MKVRISLLIEAPRAHVWSLFEDLEKLPRWVPGFVSIEVTSPPDVLEGGTYIMVTKERGKRDEVRGKNLIWTPGERIKEEMRSHRLGPGVLVADHRFADEGEGHTRFDYEHEYVVGGLAALARAALLVGRSRLLPLDVPSPQGRRRRDVFYERLIHKKSAIRKRAPSSAKAIRGNPVMPEIVKKV